MKTILLFAAILGLPGLSHAKPKTFDWLVVYYMPYDNNLSPLSHTILRQFRDSKIPSNVCVTLQVDLSGEGGMTRYAFHSRVDSVHIDQEASTSAEVLNDYFWWATQNFEARHYAVVLLNHGGQLNEYGLDDFPKPGSWMPIHTLASCLQKFNKNASIAKLDLLFQQVCTRGTIENLYEFRSVARYTLASQDLVPAPSYYYAKVFAELHDQKITSGDKLADLIVSMERDDMYYSYTLIDNAKWNPWLVRLKKSTRHFDHQSSGQIDKSQLKFIPYGSELYFDFGSLIRESWVGQPHQKYVQSLLDFTNHVLIKKLYINTCSDRMPGFSGVSVCSPFRVTTNPLGIYSREEYNLFLKVLRKLKR